MRQVMKRTFGLQTSGFVCAGLLAACAGDTEAEKPDFGSGGSRGGSVSAGGSGAAGNGGAGAAAATGGVGATGGTSSGGGGSTSGGSSAGGSGAVSAGGASGNAGSSGSGGMAGAGAGGTGSFDVLCPVTFSYTPPGGQALGSVSVGAEWNDFDPVAQPLTGPDSNGAYTRTFDLPPGVHAYKLVLNGTDWIFDPAQGYRKYVDGTENSAVRVADCSRPSLEVATFGADASGDFSTEVTFVPAVDGTPLDASNVSATLRTDTGSSAIAGSAIGVNDSKISLDLSGLAKGKYTIELTARDTDGTESHLLRMPFWIEDEPFDWDGALIYMVMTDRFVNGEPNNDNGPTSGVQDSRGDWYGGDFEGLRQRIADGTLDELGVRAIWLTPWQTNPSGAYLAADNFHNVTGYHGYWPTKAREVDPRFGGEAALKALVAEAHTHGIRILMDYVVNHVHESHEYFTQHPDWFRTGCVCGTPGCDWTADRLECLFTPYLPDVNWTVFEAGEQLGDDAVWWLDEFHLDGMRVDAVKHVEDAAMFNLATRVEDELETVGTHYFMMGETAMGWGDCSVDCNAEQYDTISRYIGDFALDGQKDFVLYHAVPYRVFAYGDKGMLHADFWTQTSQDQYPAGSIMTPFVGSHDSQRFVTLATYRGQSPQFDRGIAFNQWDNLPGPPQDAEPYQRLQLALSWVLGLPGAPLLYAGDEYGEWGGSDPGNRAMWRAPNTLSSDELATLNLVRSVGKARQELVALQTGAYSSLGATEDQLAYARTTNQGDIAIVVLSRTATTMDVTVPPSISNGTMLRDRVSGQTFSVTGGQVSVPLSAWGAAVLAP